MSLSIDRNLTSLRESFDRLGVVADKVAHNGAGEDLAGNLVEMMQVRAQVKANVAAIRTAEETLGTLIDTFA